ncbi:MAG: LytTR family DNA-binding domain-containing protein [Pelagimonas sp.]|uniref:LytTR family DNA-binding domain-containing protein n=1 Tax=Pelagimonas sp. TaxID=2073170 RepID=UPI003D6BF6C4
MQKDPTVSNFLVRFSDGGTFETTARSASEYLLDTCFIRFLFLCVMLYGILMHRDDISQLDTYTQVLLWIILFIVTAAWLVFSVNLNLFLVRRGYVSHVFTPALIFPMVPINIIAAGFVAEFLGAEYWLAFPENVAPIAQNLLAAVCFDILHGRYVAPTHPTFVPPVGRKTSLEDRQDIQFASMATASDYGPAPDERDLTSTEMQSSEIDNNIPEFFVTISGQRLDLRDIVYLQSEDHYLKIQQVHSSMMLRGRLKETVEQLDHRLGIQINRSVWIAFASVKSVEENDAGYLEVTLLDDTTFKITNSRKMMFLQNYRLYSFEISA